MYQASTAAEGKRIADHVIGSFHDCPIPEVARLGRTLRMCRQHVLARFETHRISNGGTEAVNLIIEKTRRLAHGFRTFHCTTDPNPACRLRQPALSTRHDPRLTEEPPNDEDVEVAIWYRAPAIRLNESLGFERHPNRDCRSNGVDVWQWIDREGVEHGERVPCIPGLKSCRISPGLPRSCKDFRLESSGLLRLASLRGWRSFAVRQEGRRVGRPAAHGRRRGRW